MLYCIFFSFYVSKSPRRGGSKLTVEVTQKELEACRGWITYSRATRKNVLQTQAHSTFTTQLSLSICESQGFELVWVVQRYIAKS